MNEKENKKLIRWFFSLMVIVVLFVPAIAVYEIEGRTVTNILTYEGLHTNGTEFTTLEPVVFSEFENMYSLETVTLTQSNKDSCYVKEIGAVSEIAYTNSVNYIGNGTYSVTPNYSIHSNIPLATLLDFAIPLNITTWELAEFDFIRLYSNSEHAFNDLIFRSVFNNAREYLYFDEIRNNTYIIPISISIRNTLLSSPNSYIYVLNSGLDKTDVTWNFKCIGFNLDAIHQFAWDDNQLYLVSLLIMSAILTPLAIFSSKVIDLKLDKGKPGGNR